jgi:hypothetical protein
MLRGRFPRGLLDESSLSNNRIYWRVLLEERLRYRKASILGRRQCLPTCSEIRISNSLKENFGFATENSHKDISFAIGRLIGFEHDGV